MIAEGRRLHLGLFFFATGYHPAGWRLPDAKADGSFDVDFMVETAKAIEAANFDFFFLGDTLSTSAAAQYQRPSQLVRLEPLSLLSVIAAATTRIGLVITINTSYTEPFHVARQLASLDHISKGRAAWNVVTGLYELEPPAYFGRARPDGSERFERAEEFISVVRQLWDSWGDDVFIRDKATGEFVDPTKVRPLDHRGKHFRVNGPLNVIRPPQGQLPILHAGRSEESLAFAARHADILFSMHTDSADALDYRRQIETRRHGLSSQGAPVRLMPGLIPIVGPTTAEARAIYERLNALQVTERSIPALSAALSFDLSRYSLDTLWQDVLAREAVLQAARQVAESASEILGRDTITLADLISYVAATRHSRFLLAVGSAEDVADKIQHWFSSGAADGFIICPAYYPGGLDDFITGVVPLLQRRGLFPAAYGADTMWGHFGLARPDVTPPAKDAADAA